MVEELYQLFSPGGTPVNQWRYIYTFDGNNNLIEELYQRWDALITFSWVNIWKEMQTHDGNNNKIEWLRQEWDGSVWVNIFKEIYSYIPTGIEQLADGIKSYSLSNNYPNPFNPSTKIKYSVPQSSNVAIKVFDILGREVYKLVNDEKPAGYYEIEFNASSLTSGIYFYRLQAGSFVETKKMVLLK
jgi:hypothetical protein